MSRKLLIICNKRHERVRARRAVRIVTRRLRAVEIEFDLVYTRKLSEIKSAAGSAGVGGFSEILCVGGDGTLNLIANEIAGSSVVLSVIPGGTGNILARYLNVPGAIRRALGLVVREAPVIDLDVIKRGSRCSLLNVSAGASSLTMTYVDDRMKRVLGIAAYGLQLLKHLLLRSPTAFSLRLDGAPVHARAHEVIVCNTGFPGTPLASLFRSSTPDDGWLECYAFKFDGLPSILALLHDLMTSTALRSAAYLKRWEFRESFHLESDPPLPVQSDGDRLGSGTMDLAINPSALRVRSGIR